MIKKVLKLVVMTLLVVGITTSTVCASSDIVHFSAFLENDQGPLNGTYPLTVKLMDANRSVIWQETHSQAFNKGSFTIPIGGGTHDTSLTPEIVNNSTYLEITVANESVLLSFTSSFYSLIARQTDKAVTANVALSANSIHWDNISNKPPFVTSATVYTAARGLVLGNNTFSIDQSIIASKNYVDQAVSGITASSVADNSITSEKIINGSIDNLDISETAGISFTKLAISDSQIPYAKLNIPAGSIAYNQMTVADYEIPFSKINIPAGSIGYNQLTVADSEIPISKISIGDGSISGTKIENGSITSTNLAANSINGTKIEDQSITGADIATNSITYPKLILNNQEIPFTKLNILKSDIVGLGIPESDTSVTYNAGAGMQLSDNTFSIANTVVTKNYNQSITINATLNADELKGDGSGITNINGQNIQDSTIQYSKLNLANGAIPFSKLTGVQAYSAGLTSMAQSSVPSNRILYTIGTNSYSTTALTSTARLLLDDNSTADMRATLGLVIGTNVHPFIQDGGLSGTKLQAATITSTNMASDSINGAKIQDQSITGADIASDTITYPKLGLNNQEIPFIKLNIQKSDIVGLGIPENDTDTTYSAGRGIQINNTTISIANTVVTNNYAGAVTFNTRVVSNQFIGEGSRITGIDGQNIQDSSIQYAKLNLTDGDIPIEKLTGVQPLILDGGLDGIKLQAATITSMNLADNSINGTKIQDQSINSRDVDNSIVTSNYKILATNNNPIIKFSNNKSGTSGALLELAFPQKTNPTTDDFYINFSDASGVIGELSGNGGGEIKWPSGMAGLQNSSQDAIAFNNSKGVVLQSTGADYAEYIQRQNPAESFSPCDIVGIKNGKVVSSLEPADQFMVISQRPIVIGNAYEGSKKSSELVSFIGQIYVKVRGSVQSGQYIIASNNEAGVGIAKDGDKLTRDDYSRVIGKAWETSS